MPRAEIGTEPSRKQKAGVAGAPLTVSEERCPAGGPAIEIELSGARVRVSPGVDPVLLADVLRTLKALG